MPDNKMFRVPGGSQDSGEDDSKKNNSGNPTNNFDKYIELNKKLDFELTRNEQLSIRFHKFFELQTSFNDEYLNLSKKYENASQAEKEELNKILDKMYLKSEKFSNILGMILEASKTNNPHKTWEEISIMEEELRNELDYDPNNLLSTYEERNRGKIYDPE